MLYKIIVLLYLGGIRLAWEKPSFESGRVIQIYDSKDRIGPGLVQVAVLGVITTIYLQVLWVLLVRTGRLIWQIHLRSMKPCEIQQINLCKCYLLGVLCTFRISRKFVSIHYLYSPATLIPGPCGPGRDCYALRNKLSHLLVMLRTVHKVGF